MQPIGKHTIEEWLIAELEGDLTSAQLAELHAFLEQNPEFSEWRAAFQNTILTPDTAVVFEHKEILKKAETAKIVPLWSSNYLRLAAAILLIIMVSTLVLVQLSGSKDQHSPIQAESSELLKQDAKQVDGAEENTHESPDDNLNIRADETPSDAPALKAVTAPIETYDAVNEQQDRKRGHLERLIVNKDNVTLSNDLNGNSKKADKQYINSIVQSDKPMLATVDFYSPESLGNPALNQHSLVLKQSELNHTLLMADAGKTAAPRLKSVVENVEMLARGGKTVATGLGEMAGFFTGDLLALNRDNRKVDGFADISDAPVADDSQKQGREFRINAGPFKFYKRTNK